MTKEEFISSGLLEQYALNTQTPEEGRLVIEYLNKFPELEEDLNQIEEVLELYAMQNAKTPGRRVKDNLMGQLFPEQKSDQDPVANAVNMDTRKSAGSFYKFAAAAMLIFLIGSIASSYHFYNQLKESQHNLVIAQQSFERQQKINESLAGNLDIVTDKYAQSVTLKGTPQAPQATAKIFWMKNTGQVYVDPRDLPAPPSGKQYQLWAIVDGKPVDAGMVSTEKGNYVIQKMKSFGKADAFAITLEKAGGSPTPTMSEMVVISEL